MPAVVEFELSYLAKTIPPELTQCEHTVIEDMYFPASAPKPLTRIRRKGNTYQFSKKIQLDPNDAAQHQDMNIGLTAEEYGALAKGDGRSVQKTRYLLPCNDRIAEVDIFTGDLQGLVVVSFVFSSAQERDTFKVPDFCLADVTQETFIAGGMLAGKTYKDITPELERFQYRPLTLST